MKLLKLQSLLGSSYSQGLALPHILAGRTHLDFITTGINRVSIFPVIVVGKITGRFERKTHSLCLARLQVNPRHATQFLPRAFTLGVQRVNIELHHFVTRTFAGIFYLLPFIWPG